MIEKLRVLETRLSQQVGKFTRYENLVRERGAVTSDEKILIAEEVLNGPWIGVLGAMAEHKKSQS